jgi:lysylphosphatidylglycerol synthetase-like protein (DUF2156 family)
MNETFKTKFGNIRIHEEKILISDNSKIQFLLIEMILTLNVITSLLFIFSHGFQFDFKSYLWAIICASSVFILLALLRFTHKKELHSDEIHSIKCRERFGNQILSLYLKNKRIRRVYLLADKQNNQALLIHLKTSLNLEL